MTTLDRIHGQCRQEGDCLVWTGHTNGSGIPKVCNESGRRLVWQLAKGPLTRKQYVSNWCGCLGCLNPEHLMLKSKAKISKDAHTKSMRQRRTVSNAIVARAHETTKLTIEKAREIRASDEKQDILAERYGVHRSLISQIQRGKAWKELSNPFAGLGAR